MSDVMSDVLKYFIIIFICFAVLFIITGCESAEFEAIVSKLVVIDSKLVVIDSNGSNELITYGIIEKQVNAYWR